jgi:hypothetical protein
MTKSVFISSTSQDLKPFRLAVKASIERLRLNPIVMEHFGSQPGGAIEVSLEEVERAHIFVGILAHHYGYVPNGAAKSVTEQEYEEAVRHRIPRLMYLVDPNYAWPKELIETDPIAQQRLAKFKSRIETKEVRTLFTTADNLARQVAVDLAKELLQQRQRRN